MKADVCFGRRGGKTMRIEDEGPGRYGLRYVEPLTRGDRVAVIAFCTFMGFFCAVVLLGLMGWWT